jgi:hypothetical protein
MTITIGFGTWLIPLGFTILFFFIANWLTKPTEDDKRNKYHPVYMIGSAFQSLFAMMVALIASLIAWVIYFAVT